MDAQLVLQVARPLGSPRITPNKRPAPPNLDSLDISPPKCTKRAAPVVELEFFKKAEPTPEKKVPELLDLDEAVKRAIAFYKELWILQTIEEECGYPQDEDTREDRSGLACEKWASEHYEAIRTALNALLPWAGGVKPAGVGADYDVLEIQGEKPAGLKDAYAKRETKAEKQQIRDYRDSSKRSQAREALVTVCSALSCRREKLWVEFSECSLVDIIKKSALRRVKSRKMLSLITNFINAEVEKGNWCCQFACALVRAESYIRIAFGRDICGSIPASILIVHRMPLWNVFLKMEDDTPFNGDASKKTWWNHKRRQVAFQELNMAEKDPDMRNERLPAAALMPDPEIKKLLQSQTQVVYLDILAALSTREASKKYRLSDIVKAELAMLFREAKAKGEAVIFVLAANDPRVLAEKVYLRPPLNEWGLKCGYFRWRASPTEPWAREKEYSNRTTFMLQMP